MARVGLDVGGEEVDPRSALDPVVLCEALDLRGGHSRHLGLVRVQGREAGRGRLGRRLPVRLHQGPGGLVGLGPQDVLPTDADGLREAEPQLGVVVGAVLLVPQVVQHQLALRAVLDLGVDRREEPRERGLEGVVLTRVLLQVLDRQRALGPLRVERVGQQMALLDEVVDLVEHLPLLDSMPVQSATDGRFRLAP
ncbi:MAG: hypothetical protein WD770_11570 [Actinomycetota bacterium]